MVASPYLIGVIRSSLRTLAKAAEQVRRAVARLELSPSSAPGLDGLAAGNDTTTGQRCCSKRACLFGSMVAF